jgi:putative endonuclease
MRTCQAAKNDMPVARQQTGKEGEGLAGEWLKKKGWKILQAGYRSPYGEIDLICEDKNELVFVEVKTRTSDQFGYPEEAITSIKARHMLKAAQWIVQKEHWQERPWRMDVVAILKKPAEQTEYVHILAIDAGEKTW